MDPAVDSAVRSDETGANDLAQRVVLGALLVELLVLAATGVALFFLYRPSADQALAAVDVTTGSAVTALRTVHRAAASLTLLTAVGAVGVFVTTPGRKRTRAMSAALVAVVAAAAFTGYLLPWDQLALRAVTAGEGLSGYRPMFGDRVRFVLIGGTEVRPDTILRWLGVHAVVLTPLALLLVIFLWRQRRRTA
jgi:quinol-cytochrome oxidoreductase complex cytochrome b subunit